MSIFLWSGRENLIEAVNKISNMLNRRFETKETALFPIKSRAPIFLFIKNNIPLNPLQNTLLCNLADADFQFSNNIKQKPTDDEKKTFSK